MDLQQKIAKMLTEQLDAVDEIKGDTKLSGDLGMDSLDLQEFSMNVEEAFVLEVKDEDADRWVTVQDVVEYLRSRVTLV